VVDPKNKFTIQLIDYFLKQNELDENPEIRRRQIQGEHFKISFREYIEMVGDSCIVKV
jgi:hypothetical protein